MDDLINNIKILKENSDYRVTDIILKKGNRWKHSGRNVLKLKKYKNTILRRYLEMNSLNKKHNLKLFLGLIINYIKKKKIKMPRKDEIVMHLRLGDVIVHDWFLSKNYVKLIKNIIKKDKKIKKLTIITCFAYQVFTKDSLHLKRKNVDNWNFTDEKHKENIIRLKKVLEDIKENININIQIYSNTNIDKDLCYAIGARYFIKDKGGFSSLLDTLNKLNKKMFFIHKRLLLDREQYIYFR